MHVAAAHVPCADTHMATDTPGSRFRRLRTSLGLTQDDIARRGGLERSSVVKFEGGTTQGRSATLRAGIAKALGLTIEDVGKVFDGTITPKTAAALAKVPHQAAPLPPETAMGESPDHIPLPGRGAYEFSRVLTDAFRAGHGDAEDFDAVRHVIVEAGDLHITEPSELTRLAVRLLTASKRLRVRGVPVAWSSLMVELGVNVRPLDDDDGAPVH